MTALAPTLQAFFTDRLTRQKNASPHTITAYRDTLRLLLVFAQQRGGTPPSRLGIEDLDAAVIAAFLDHLERDRGNSVRSRNARLAAIHSLFSFAALRHPEHAGLIQRVLAIPPKRFARTVVSYLTDEEAEALAAAPDTSRRIGRRDHALLAVAIQTGLRVSELTGLQCQDLSLGRGPYVRCTGKGRKQRCTPLTSQTVAILQTWLRERSGQPADPLFATSRGKPLSRDAVALLVTRHAATASQSCTSLQAKTITPPHAPSHRGNATAARRRGHLRHRAVARARENRHRSDLPACGSDLPACGPQPEGTSPRPHHAARHSSRALPAAR